jgi:WD40 repeat protein
VVASAAASVRLWDAGTGRARGVLAGTLLGFVRRTGHLVTLADRKVRYWDVTGAAPREVAAIPHGGGGNRLSPDGKTLAEFVPAGALRLWEVGEGQVRERAVLRGHTRGVWDVAFSADGRTLVSCGGDPVVRVWDLKESKPSEIASLSGAAKQVQVSLSPDGKTLAAQGSDGTVRLWDLGGRKPAERPGIKGAHPQVASLAFAPDGKTLACADNWLVLRLWDVSGREVRKGAEVLRFGHGHTGFASALAFAPDGKTLVTGGSDHTVRLWDLGVSPPRQRVGPRGHVGAVSGVAFAPDRPLLASSSGHDGTTRLWDLAGGAVREQAVLPGGGWGPLAFAPDGKGLAVCSSPGRLWDLSGAAPRARAVLPPNARGLAFSGDGKLLATAGWRPMLGLWDLSQPAARQRLALAQEEGQQSLNAIALSPDGTLLVGGRDSWNETLLVWRITQSGLARVRVPRGRAKHVAFAPDGQTLALSDGDGDILLWDLRGPVPLSQARLSGLGIPGWSGVLRGLTFSADGRWLAASNQAGRVIVWESATAAKRHEWKFPGEVGALAFAADSRHLATGNSNGTVYVLRLPDNGPARR